MADICSDPKGHVFIMQPDRSSKCGNCARTEKYDDVTKSWVVTKK